MTESVAGTSETAETVDDVAAAAAPPAADIEVVYELSPTQQAMLFHSLYAKGSGVYIVQLVWRLAGRLDVAAFERAWRSIVDRHATLRTGFHWEDLEKPVQVVYRHAHLEVARESWRDAGPAGGEEQRARLERYLDADREQGFDLAEPPLMRLAVFELAPDVHQIVWSHHHLLSDGWSLGLLLRELFVSYAAFASGRDPALERPRPYREHIAWLQRQDLAEAEAFWRSALAGFSSPAFLAGGEAREADFRDARKREIRLSAGEMAALRETARRHRLTLNTLVQGAWAVLLDRWSGGAQDEVVFGGTVSGRPAELAGVESMVGPFINTLPVRVEIAPDRLLLPWLAGLQEKQVEQRRYDYAPLYQVQGWSELPAGVALFDNILVFENYPLDNALAGLLPDLEISELAVNELTNYPVHLVVFPGAELLLELRYDSSRVETPAAVRLLEHLAGLLRTFAQGLERELGSLSLLSPSERHQMVAEWNDTAAEFPAGLRLHDLVAAQAARTPEAVAVAAETEKLTYRELEERADRIAGRLAALGVGPEARVAVFAERTPALVAALLGVLKAGGAYVPIDPAFPRERVDSILADSGARAVLTDLDAGLPEGAVLLPLQRSWGGPGRGLLSSSEEDPSPTLPSFAGEGVSPENLAYVIYTSGSTGKPKGVELSHRGVVNYLTSMARRPGLAASDVMMAVTTISFDISVTELFLPLMVGARIELVRRETAGDAAKLAAVLEAAQATVMQATPSSWTLLLEGGWQGRPGLKALCGGEALPRALADRLLPRVGELWNVYGPTETTVWSTLQPVGPEGRISIGRPLANTTVHLLDRTGGLLPMGVAGELAIGGAGLARGYHGRPDLTAERFVPDPFGPPGSRLYRTGDLARTLPDGSLEALGRIDHQVKIRGVRIEPGEIQAVLAGHPALRDCAVVAREDGAAGGGATVLVAYVVPDPQDPPDLVELRTYLSRRLPDAMVPTAFVPLEALPLTPSGKLDRRSLPGLDASRRESTGEIIAPRTPTEEALLEIFKDVLNLDRVSIDDSFFQLGGHSLLATQAMGRVQQAFGVEISVRELFRSSTVVLLAEQVDALVAESSADDDLARLLDELDLLSDEEARSQLGDLGSGPGET